MNFLLDVNASGAVASWLIHLGHGVVEVGQKDPRMSDNEILSWAVMERRIIVTTDNDFEEMIWRQGKPHCGVLRLENLLLRFSTSDILGYKIHGKATAPIFHVRCSVPSAPL